MVDFDTNLFGICAFLEGKYTRCWSGLVAWVHLAQREWNVIRILTGNKQIKRQTRVSICGSVRTRDLLMTVT